MRKLLAACLVSITATTTAQTRIECNKPPSKDSALWPQIHLSTSGQLCFDVRGWVEYRGANCVANGQSIQWEGIVIVMSKGESQGRDTTRFRVVRPTVTNDQIGYLVEWSRGEGWTPHQSVQINRLTGDGVDYFIGEHGGAPMECRAAAKKI